MPRFFHKARQLPAGRRAEGIRCAAFGVRRRLRLWPLIPIWCRSVPIATNRQAQVTDAVEGNNAMKILAACAALIVTTSILHAQDGDGMGRGVGYSSCALYAKRYAERSQDGRFPVFHLGAGIHDRRERGSSRRRQPLLRSGRLH
jgi:hypothetical protein